MSHEITIRKNGKAEMAYVGTKPWHGLGEELPAGAPIETWLAAAGMDWTVQRSKVRYAVARNAIGDTFAEWPDYHVLMRSDTKAPLGMVSDGFKVVQPKDVLEFFRDLVEVAGFKLETAGTLRGGSKCWALASIGAEDNIVGRDLVRGRLMMATAFDGTMKTLVKNVAERVVCANTLRIALGESGAPEVKVSHRSVFDAKAVKAQLGIAVDSFARFIVDARRLAARKVDMAEANALVGGLFDPTLSPNAKAPLSHLEQIKAMAAVADDKAFKKIIALFGGEGRGANLPGVKGTAWGVVNAVTEYVDHHARARNDSNRIESAWFGRGEAMKAQAMEDTLVYVLR